MEIALVALLSTRIAEAEAAMAALNLRLLSGEMEALIPDVGALTDAERRGCLAEIVGHRFATTTSADRGPWDSYFCPQSSGIDAEGTEHHFPDARQIDAEIVEYWKARSEQTPHPILRSRYADLAWEIGRIWNREHPSEPQVQLPRELAQRAIDAYLESAKLLNPGAHLELFKAWEFVDRALDLAIRIKDKPLAERAKAFAFDFNRANRRAGHAGQWWLVDNWAWDRKGLTISDAEREELVGWLEESLDLCADMAKPQNFDPHLALDAADRIARWSRKSGRPELGGAAIKKAGKAFESIAGQANALTAISWLEDVGVRYRQENLADDVARVDAAIVSRGKEAHESMRMASAPIHIPMDEMEAWLDERTAGSARLALGRIAMDLISTEDLLRSIVEDNAVNAPFYASVKISIMDGQGFTSATIGSIKEDMPGRLLSLAATVMAGNSPMLAQALERAKSRWGIGAAEFTAFLTESPLFPPHSHKLLGIGIEAWFANDFVKAVHVLVPQVEAALREMLKAHGESPMKHNPREGGFETLGMGTILMTEAFRTKVRPMFGLHFRALYTSPKGINLRNKLAHGLAGPDAFGWGMAHWVAHSLLAIRTLGHLED
ncbi:DUF4209 domain-containing protein [Janthinobacterium sp. LB3P118]|uniref:DUF4209 domain-containing protein n=1 Tax=Janthinobacterium sp. LB3P118 TaxID=3424195 RepID=UPI003F28804E